MKKIDEKLTKQKEKLKQKLEKQDKKNKETVKEFKKFAFSANIVDMSIGVIIGTGFKAIVTSFTNDIIMPVISIFTKNINFENMFISLDGTKYETLELAKAAGASTINYGLCLTAIIDFLITAIFIFIALRQLKKITNTNEKKKEETTKKCDYCKTEISKEATRCPHCTSILVAEPVENKVDTQTPAAEAN